MKKSTLLIFGAIFLAVFVVAVSHAYACDPCETIGTVGNVQIDTDQNMSNLTDIPSCYNYVRMTTDIGDQTIWGRGFGDNLVSVSADAYLGQEAPYDTGDIAVPHGTVTHSGDSVMEITGGAGTNPFCHDLALDISANRKSIAYNVLGADFMKSSLDSAANFRADISGADPSFGVNIHVIDTSKAETPAGRIQTNRTELKVFNGSSK